MNIQAIQTYYRGTYYRSRIEARWAVFFDVLGLKYNYEPEKFSLSSGAYIPDFFVKSGVGCTDMESPGLFYEVKGAQPDADTLARFDEFRSLMFHPTSAEIVHGGINDYEVMPRGKWPSVWEIRWRQCPFCGAFGLIPWISARAGLCVDRFECQEARDLLRKFDVSGHFFDMLAPISPSINMALSAAQSARFEDRSIDAVVATSRNGIQALTTSRVFCEPAWMATVLKNLKSLSDNPDCPRWYHAGRPLELTRVQ